MYSVLHIVVTSKLSGAERMALIIGKNMMNKYRPVLICGGDELKNHAQSLGIKSYSLNFNNTIFTLLKIKEIIEKENIKLIHAHDNRAVAYAYLVRKIFLLNVKIISHIHSCYSWLNKASLYKIFDRLVRKNVDATITCGSLVYDYYIKYAKYVDRSKLHNISNFIDISDMSHNVNNVRFLRDNYNIKENKFVFGYIGRLTQEKGILQFIYELANHIKKFDDCYFFIIGDGDLEKELKDTIKKLKLNDKVIMTGYQSNVYNFYKIIDVLFLTSQNEGLPMVVLEAMANGIPVISMNVGSVSEVIENTINGWLVDVNNYKNFIEIMHSIKENKNNLAEIKRNAQKTIYENYSVYNQINKFFDIYRCLLG